MADAGLTTDEGENKDTQNDVVGAWTRSATCHHVIARARRAGRKKTEPRPTTAMFSQAGGVPS